MKVTREQVLGLGS